MIASICWKCGRKYQSSTAPSVYCPACVPNVTTIHTSDTKATTMVEIVKVKRGVPTVIRVSGREYILRAEGQFNQRKKGAVKRD